MRWAQATGRNKSTYLASLLPVLMTAVLAALVLSARHPPSADYPPPKPRHSGAVVGAAAPDFTATAVRGTQHTLSRMQDKVILLSFVEVQAPADSEEAQPSRAQITFLKSMYRQYAPKGLVVLLIDGSHLRSKTATDRNTLYNMTFDWNLGDLPVISDDQKESLASKYGVTTLPTTFLIDGERRIVERWEGVASAPHMARRLQELIGLPMIPE